MKEHKIVLTWEAIYDIADAEVWIYDNFGDVRASKYRVTIRKELSSISYQAGITGDTKIIYRGHTIYKRLFSPAIIFYIIVENEVHILRVLREEVDWQKYFSEHNDFNYTYPEEEYTI